ncbi:hypothetical protein ACLESO_10905, partial [Pyxidicoccus sp. 3LG]
FSGQRTGAVRLTSGRLEVEGASFEASVSETTGVLVEGASGDAEEVPRGARPGPQRLGTCPRSHPRGLRRRSR